MDTRDGGVGGIKGKVVESVERLIAYREGEERVRQFMGKENGRHSEGEGGEDHTHVCCADLSAPTKPEASRGHTGRMDKERVVKRGSGGNQGIGEGTGRVYTEGKYESRGGWGWLTESS